MPGDRQDCESEFQERLIRSLQTAAPYAHAVDQVEVIETHISCVLLAGEYAYKIKKAVDLGFLDFRSLQSRLHFCHEEVRLNRRSAPDIYLRVVPITGSAGAPRVDGDGPPIEYAVMMRRFEQRARLDCLLADGAMSDAIVDQLAARVVEFHRSIAVAQPGQGFGTLQTISQAACQNIEQLLPLLDDAADRAALADYDKWLQAQHRQLGDRFAQRLETGFVRECHGDLHLANIVLIDGRVVLFDCIEFNAQFRWIDVFNEIAFLAMDLHSRGKPGWAWRLIDRYLEATGDYPGLALLRYYLAYRALVRAKIDLIRARQLTHGDAADATHAADRLLLAKGHAHVRLALDCCAPPRPALLITHGFSGSGKTRGSQSLLERLGAIRLRSDIVRKQLHGIAPLQHGNHAPGRGLYSDEATRATYARLGELAGGILRAGYTVIVDAAFLQRRQRAAFRALAAECGVALAIIHFTAPVGHLRQRIARRHAAGSDASDADLAVLDHQLATHEPLQAGEADFVLVRESDASPDAGRADDNWQPLLDFLAAAKREVSPPPVATADRTPSDAQRQ